MTQIGMLVILYIGGDWKAYHISGRRVFMPSQLYTFKMASQNLPHEGIPTAPPVRQSIMRELSTAFVSVRSNINKPCP